VFICSIIHLIFSPRDHILVLEQNIHVPCELNFLTSFLIYISFVYILNPLSVIITSTRKRSGLHVLLASKFNSPFLLFFIFLYHNYFLLIVATKIHHVKYTVAANLSRFIHGVLSCLQVHVS
jgi:uncharacterized membrane-anchored protein